MNLYYESLVRQLQKTATQHALQKRAVIGTMVGMAGKTLPALGKLVIKHPMKALMGGLIASQGVGSVSKGLKTGKELAGGYASAIPKAFV